MHLNSIIRFSLPLLPLGKTCVFNSSIERYRGEGGTLKIQRKITDRKVVHRLENKYHHGETNIFLTYYYGRSQIIGL